METANHNPNPHLHPPCLRVVGAPCPAKDYTSQPPNLPNPGGLLPICSMVGWNKIVNKNSTSHHMGFISLLEKNIY